MSIFKKLAENETPALPTILPPAPLTPPAPPVPGAAPVAPVEKPPTTFRDFGDSTAVRKAIYSRTLAAARNIKPVTNARYSLALEDVDYEDPEDHPIAKQKHAILNGENLSRRLRGTWVLKDAAGNLIEKKRSTLAQVPYLTPRGTFIMGGSEYTLAHQMRLRPGVYTRIKENGELESHANVLPGKGMSHRYGLEPETGVFKLHIGQASMPLLPVLRAFGMTDSQLRSAWGDELFTRNAAKSDPRVVDKLFQRLVRKADPEASAEDKARAVREALEKMQFDPEVNKHTLGAPHKNVNAETILAITNKLLRVNRGEEEPDDRDHLAYQTFMGPEDLISERMERVGSILNPLLWKASTKGSLRTLPVNSLDRHLRGAVLDSGLGTPLEEINPLDVFDQQTRVTRLGMGGIPSLDSVPDESRSVHPSQVGFIDLLRTPESLKAGVDTRIAYSAKKGSDGRLYAPFRDPKTGKTIFKSPQDVTSLTLAFPNEMESGEKMVHALANGRARAVPRESVDLILPHVEQWFSPVTNLVPLKPAVKGQRVSMGSRFSIQALPLVHAEAPLVRTVVPGTDKAFVEHYGRHAGAVYAKDQPGRVESVTPDGVRIKYADGTTEEHQLYNQFPYNRKSVCGATEIVILRDGCVTTHAIRDYAWRAGDRTLSVDPVTKCSDWLEVKGYIKHDNTKKLVKVSTASGRSVTVTEDHSLVTLGNGGHLLPIYPKDCIVGRTRLPVAMLPYIPSTVNYTADMGYLAGLYLSEGHCPSTQPGLVMIAVKPRARKLEVDELIRRLGARPHARKKNAAFTDKKLWTFLKEFGHLSHGKFIPNWVLQAPVEFRRALVAGYMAGDGCLWHDRNSAVQVTAVSVSKRLRDDLVDLLATLGVFSTLFDAPRNCLNENWRDGFGFRVISRDIAKLPQWFFYADREVKLRALVSGKYRASTFEMIPVYDDAQKDLLYAGYKCVPKKAYKATELAAVPKDTASASESVYGLWGRSDVMWDKITSIEEVETEAEVYDLCIAKSEAFAVCHGLVVHNTLLHNTALVQPGDPVTPGQVLAKSNYTDDKGHIAFGLNTRVAYMPFAGANYEDAFAISEGYAKRTASEHLYQHQFDLDDKVRKGKKNFVGIFPAKFDKTKLQTVDDDGVVKPGTTVMPGDPLILAAAEREMTHKNVHAGHKGSFSDKSVVWEHHAPGIVTDVAKTSSGYVVAVKSINQTQVGDKISGLYGDKGVISKIIPEDQMPRDPKTGETYEVLANPLGIISRTNPAQMHEGWFGRIARATGKPIHTADFADGRDMTAHVLKELEKHGLTGMEEVEDPVSGRRVNVATGVRYMLKLHHTSESKHHGRGLGAYTSEDAPAKGGTEGAKRLALMDVNALLSHGATKVLRDAKLVRGQKNQEYWSTFMAGMKPPTPAVPLVYRKFINHLRAAGVNVERKGSQLHLMALTDKDIDGLAENRELKNTETVDWRDGMKPVRGGLFDTTITGGHGGNKWAFIKLHEPMPNPVMEEPIRKLLKLTGERYDKILAGEEALNEKTGPAAIQDALSKINIPMALRTAREEIQYGRKGVREDAVRRLGYLKAAETTGVHPKDWVLTKVPVLPPSFRPVSQMQTGTQLVADANYLYKELFDANENLKNLSGKVENLSDERRTLYAAFKGVTGLGDPVQPKNQERRVKGLLAQVFGDSPKFGQVQQKLLGTTLDLIGRAVVIPNPDLSMDEVGLPESRAWEVYSPFIVRRLVKSGMERVAALEAVRDKNDYARKALLSELDERPVIVNRAPVLHRYGRMAFYPRLVKGDTLQVSPLVVGGFGMDFDGDTSNYEVPAEDEAAKEALEKMLPSRNLISTSDFKRPMYVPRQEYVGGLHAATSSVNTSKKERVFATKADFMRAFWAGELDPDAPVNIMQP